MRNIYILIGCLFFLISSFFVKADESEQIENQLIKEAITKDPYFLFLNHIFWPDDKTIQLKKINNDIVYNELIAFTNNCKRIFNDNLLFPSNATLNAIPLVNYANEEDYILLKYFTSTGLKVEIQDGTSLNVLVSQTNSVDITCEDTVKKFIYLNCFGFIRFPDLKMQNFYLFISNMELGKSKCGYISYRINKNRQLVSYYSKIMWWTDGRKLLFSISKLTDKEFEIMNNTPKPEKYIKKRKFTKIQVPESSEGQPNK